MHCVQVVREDFDTVLKTMFRTRGETQRIDIADALGRHYYHSYRLGTQFEMAVGSMRYCLRVRNQYAHCVWWDDHSGNLAFANLEEIATGHDYQTDLKSLTAFHVDVNPARTVRLRQHPPCSLQVCQGRGGAWDTSRPGNKALGVLAEMADQTRPTSGLPSP